MTVAELQRYLSNYPPDLKVTYLGDWGKAETAYQPRTAFRNRDTHRITSFPDADTEEVLVIWDR